ncbi:MAG: hypothetical protein ACI86M_003645 [Saprospiraceae bacterium]|jgi:hypothetical protein
MIRIILTNILFFVAVSFVSAQFTIAPGCLLLEGTNVGQIVVDIEIINGTDDDELVYWNFEKADDFPEDWKFQICDMNLCYDWGVDQCSSSSFSSNKFPAGLKGKFSLYVQNAGNTDSGPMLDISGSSYGTLRLYADNTFEDPIAETSCTVSTQDDVEIEDLVIYPNPTTDLFQIKNDANVSTLSIYNIVGRQISKLNHTQGMVHDVSNLRAGMYLVRLENKGGEVVKAMRLSKK